MLKSLGGTLIYLSIIVVIIVALYLIMPYDELEKKIKEHKLKIED